MLSNSKDIKRGSFLVNLSKQWLSQTTMKAKKESEGNNNGVEEDPTNNMPLFSEVKGKDIKELKKVETVVAPTPSETDKEREPLPLPSLHKVANPYRLPIPLKCHPKEADNDTKPLKLKDLGSFMVNISIEGKRICKLY